MSGKRKKVLPEVRIEVRYRGRVQGVGFRWQVSNIASSYECSGYVKNMPDGSVELLVEGQEPEVRRMVDEINARMQGYCHEKTEDKRVGQPQYQSFTITR